MNNLFEVAKKFVIYLQAFLGCLNTIFMAYFAWLYAQQANPSRLYIVLIAVCFLYTINTTRRIYKDNQKYTEEQFEKDREENRKDK